MHWREEWQIRYWTTYELCWPSASKIMKYIGKSCSIVTSTFKLALVQFLCYISFSCILPQLNNLTCNSKHSFPSADICTLCGSSSDPISSVPSYKPFPHISSHSFLLLSEIKLYIVFHTHTKCTNSSSSQTLPSLLLSIFLCPPTVDTRLLIFRCCSILWGKDGSNMFPQNIGTNLSRYGIMTQNLSALNIM
jgi:hypothetical protein